MKSREEMDALVRAAGTDNAGVFNGPEGEYHLQQVPEEYIEWLLFLQNWHENTRPIRSFLEIGTASGGNARMMWDLFKPEKIVLVDNNSHISGMEQRKVILAEVPHEEIIGNSEDNGVLWQVEQTFGLAGQSKVSDDMLPDLVFIDGNHDDPFPRKDAIRYGCLGRLTAFHDSVHLEGPRKACEWMGAKGSGYEEIFSTFARYGITAFARR